MVGAGRRSARPESSAPRSTSPCASSPRKNCDGRRKGWNSACGSGPRSWRPPIGRCERASGFFERSSTRHFSSSRLLDPDGTILEVNQTALEFAGISRDEVVGRAGLGVPVVEHRTRDTAAASRIGGRRQRPAALSATRSTFEGPATASPRSTFLSNLCGTTMGTCC